MKISSKRLVEIIGLVSVVASLLFVAFELQQANRIAIGTTEQELLQNYNSLNQLTLENNEIRALVSKLRSGSELSQDERGRAVSYAFTLNAVWLATEVAYSQGLVTEDFYQDLLLDVQANVGNLPGLTYACDIVISRGYSESEVHNKIILTLESMSE